MKIHELRHAIRKLEELKDMFKETDQESNLTNIQPATSVLHELLAFAESIDILKYFRVLASK